GPAATWAAARRAAAAAAGCRGMAAIVRRCRIAATAAAASDRSKLVELMPDSGLSGKHGLIVGVANKRSISWAIAQAAAASGARLALTYPSERLEENV